MNASENILELKGNYSSSYFVFFHGGYQIGVAYYNDAWITNTFHLNM